MDEPLVANSGQSDDEPLAQKAILELATAQRKFCGVCGQPWQPEWAECPVCRNAVATKLESPRSDQRSIRSALLLYFVLLSCSAVSIIAIAAGAQPIKCELGCEIAMASVAILWAIARWRDILPTLTHMPSVKWFGAALLCAALTLGVAKGFIGLLIRLMHVSPTPMQADFFQAGYGWPIVILAIAVQPAVIEELAFRGIIFHKLQQVLSPMETIFVSALMFMVLHLLPAMFPHTLAIGLASGFLRWRTKSLYPSIFLHLVHNSLALLL